MYQTQINRYEDIYVTTAGKEKLIILAYDGIVKFINQAKINMENENIAGKSDRIFKATAVIEELAASLNMEEGGEIAEKLYALYGYMLKQLLIANMKSDPLILDEVLSLIKTLYSAWAEVIDKQPDVSVPAEPLRLQHMAA